MKQLTTSPIGLYYYNIAPYDISTFTQVNCLYCINIDYFMISLFLLKLESSLLLLRFFYQTDERTTHKLNL